MLFIIIKKLSHLSSGVCGNNLPYVNTALNLAKYCLEFIK